MNRFDYCIENGSAIITGYSDTLWSVEIPSHIEDKPVTEIKAYAFSKKEIKEIIIPDTVKKIGNYAFYLCGQLECMYISSTIENIGAGVFTGCPGLSDIYINIIEGKKSCLKEVLFELKQEVYVHYKASDGEAELLFPEFYEEAVENTPARILETHVHGCGHRYRYSFVQTEFSFREYDSLFANIIVQEQTETVLKLVLGRLRRPYRLAPEACEVYLNYLKANSTKAVSMAAEHRDTDLLRWLMEKVSPSETQVESWIQILSGASHTEGTGFLMNYYHNNFRENKKSRFEL